LTEPKAQRKSRIIAGTSEGLIVAHGVVPEDANIGYSGRG